MILRLSHPRSSTQISLIGVNHTSKASRKLVSECISAITPHYTTLELDADRASTLNTSGDLGKEMTVAMSHKSTRITRFIDQQDIFFSKERISSLRREFGIRYPPSSNESPSWIGHALFRAVQFGIFSRDMEKVCLKLTKLKAIEEDCERVTLEDVKKYMECWKMFFPNQHYHWVDLRNANMVSNLWKIVREVNDYQSFFQANPSFMEGDELRIVAVVGKAHLVGMKELWDRHYSDAVSLVVV
jgi:pheromone shutdown protein TraB